MSRPVSSTLRSAAALLSVRLVLQQIALGLLVFLLSVLWLRIPDASVVDVIGSILLGLVLLAVGGCGESLLLMRLCGVDVLPRRLARGALFCLLGVALWFGVCAAIDHLGGDDSLRAGYLNSRFPHALRNVFTYRHIMLWFSWAWTALEWIAAGLIAIAAFAMTTSERPARAMLTAVRSATFWVAFFLTVILGTMLTDLLVGWVPGKSLGVELISLIARLVVVVLVDATIASFLLCVLCILMRRDGSYSEPAGTPARSQLRTTDAP